MQTIMARLRQHSFKMAFTLVLLFCGGALGCSRQFYTEAMVDAFFGLALASVVILHLRVRPAWTDALLISVGTLLFAAIDFRVLSYPPMIMAWFSFLGLSSFLVVAVRTVWTAPRKTLLYASVPAAFFVISDYFASNMLEWTAAAHPKTLDLYLLSFDGSLRVQVAFFAGQLYALLPWLHASSLIAYIGLAVPIAVVYAGRLIRFKEKAFPAMLAFLITGPVGILFYNLFPACGPRSVFRQGFPFHPVPIAELSRLFLEPVAIQGPRNAMPSLHLVWTLLAWWYSRGLSWLERLIAFAFLALTAFATLGTGEHWFADLIVAFPFALMLQALCAWTVSWKDARRLAALCLGLVGTLLWLIALRYGARLFWTSPIVPWALSAATVALTAIRQAKLDQAADALNLVADLPSEPLLVPTREVSGAIS